MQIDERDEQEANAYDPTRETLEPTSNVTLETKVFPRKQLPPKSSILPGIMTVSSRPKHFMIEAQSILTKKTSLTAK
jgi:hypothetical protein